MGVIFIVLTILNSIGLAASRIGMGVNVRDGYPLLISKLFSFSHLKHSFRELSSCFLNGLKTSHIFCRMNKLRLFLSVIFCTCMVPINHADESTFEEVNVSPDRWSNNVGVDVFDISFDTRALEAKPEVWWRRWGLETTYFKSDAVDDDSEQVLDLSSVDVKRRLFSTTQNSFVTLGVGWTHIALDDVGENDDTQGPRLSLQSQLGVAPLLHLYGHSAWYPGLANTTRLSQPNGFEVEAGLTVKPIPHLSFRAGYRELRLDFKSLQGANESSKSQGVVLGAGFHW